MSAKIKQARALRELQIDQINVLHTVAGTAKHDPNLQLSFKLRFEQIEDVYLEFEKQHTSIIGLLAATENPDYATEKEIRAHFMEKYFDIKTIFHKMFSADANSSFNDPRPKTQNVKLPKISLSTFQGNYNDWPSFYDLYNSLIHSNNDLSPIEKFHYLLSSLSNEPLTLIKNIPLTADNYNIAYHTLIDRYQNKRLLANFCWQSIFNAQKLNTESASGLRKLLDTFNDNLAALKNLSLPVDEWDFVLFHFLVQKLDTATIKRYGLQEASTDIPSYCSLRAFLKKQCTALEAVSFSIHKPKLSHSMSPSKSSQSAYSSKPSSFVTNASGSKQNLSCILCKASHLIYKCPSFLEKSPQERFQVAKEKNWCINCLHSAHRLSSCNSTVTCRTCKGRHHSLLHFSREFSSAANNFSSQDAGSSQSTLQTSEPAPTASTSQQVHTLTNTLPSQGTVMLATAMVEVCDHQGHFQVVRALLDSASEISVLSKKCLQRLGLKSSNISLSIFGLGQMSSSSSKGVSCSIRPRGQSSPTFTIDAVILPTICGNLPSSHISVRNWKHISNLQLADPQFHVSGPIDLLLGADIFPAILRGDRITGEPGEPIALNTVFGWVLMGKVPSQASSSLVVSSLCTSLTSSLDTVIKKLWEIEEIPKISTLSPEDIQCEKIFSDTHHRLPSGRYSVALPFKGPEPSFSDSRSIALKRFFSLERRLLQTEQLYKDYSDFLQDYLDQGHMTLVEPPRLDPSKLYYIPHHCVLKPSSSTTKLRVVFDASAKTSENYSLNDCLLIGPKLQNNIVSMLLNFRLHSIVFTADIKQMYRQIEIQPQHRDYQRIFWRFAPNQPVQEYQLKTVTYGVSSAPYLAIKTLLQLAEDEGERFPLAAKVLRSDIYVDDIVTGCSDPATAISCKNQLVSLLQSGGFELRKWTSNSATVLETLPESHKALSLAFNPEEETGVKILGLKWSSTDDTFSYSVDSLSGSCTKRSILSDLARIFDPLGFLTPLTFFAKFLIQHLWTLGLDWDQEPPPNVLKRWNLYKSQLSSLSQLHISRCITSTRFLSCQLHGFADSSEKGYAAVVYLRLELPEDIFKISLICAKSKVAPLKRVSLPRLELCAAALLSDLLALVVDNYKENLQVDHIYAWTDSSVVLSWIKSSPHRWKTFVSNRVSHIQDRVPPDCWHYVCSKSNPADCASRGLLPIELINHSLWWTAPPWLGLKMDRWPCMNDNNRSLLNSPTLLEEERKINLASFITFDHLDHLLGKFSSLAKIKRILAYSLRFMHNLRNPGNRRLGALTTHELHSALMLLVKRVQYLSFSDVIGNLEQGKAILKTFKKLNPFLAEDGVLRVGGRLSHSDLSYDRRFPAILPQKHRLTELIIENVHQEHLHPGLQTVHFLLLQNFWILSPKRAIRHTLSKCIRCFKTRPVSLQPPMGNLPSVRINQIKPFQIVGVDFGGPFFITLGRARGVKSQKAYLCLFICFATKAVHLELASDLTSSTFLACLRRFVARRGRCSQIFSDCGTNFVGAHKELTQLMKEATESETIEWSFNPPSAPHFGGLWEAGIKSVKTHLIRVIGEQRLTYEELNTLLVQIEAVLNSRPMYPLSSDPNDLSVLTPGHFLTLQPLTTVPDQDLSHLHLNTLTRWQLVQRLQRDIWKRWHVDYLNTLQQRSKWLGSDFNISTGTLVLIKNALCSPLQWRLGRIERLHPGADGICRVATVKTNQGLLQRPLVKLCPLPNFKNS